MPSLSLSLNETEELCAKAARGCGHPWGVAYDIAKAVRWLAERGVSGLGALAGLLADDELKQTPVTLNKSERETQFVVAEGGELYLGACLSDYAFLLADKQARISEIKQPLLLLPFLAWASAVSRSSLYVAFGEVPFFFTNELTNESGSQENSQGESRNFFSACQFYGNPAGLPSSCAVFVSPNKTRNSDIPLWTTRTTRLQVSDSELDAFKCLEGCAYRTYAPATEASRLSGAGSALSDND